MRTPWFDRVRKANGARRRANGDGLKGKRRTASRSPSGSLLPATEPEYLEIGGQRGPDAFQPLKFPSLRSDTK